MADELCGYAGDVLPGQAWEALSNDNTSLLVDVRTLPEWTFAGVPDLSAIGKEVIMLSWQFYPSMQVNQEFCDQLAKHVPDKQTPLFFLCRIGGRSANAAKAMAEKGYTQCYNITAGFEGPLDNSNHRSTIAGWKAEALPWEQN